MDASSPKPNRSKKISSISIPMRSPAIFTIRWKGRLPARMPRWCWARAITAKCGFDRVTIGLSGGIDSALTAAIAVDALGPEHVRGVGMPSPYSSPGSIEDARSLAANLGIRFDLLPINDAFDAYRKILKNAFAGRPEDATEENIQSRIRGTLLMALSNKFG